MQGLGARHGNGVSGNFILRAGLALSVSYPSIQHILCGGGVMLDYIAHHPLVDCRGHESFLPLFSLRGWIVWDQLLLISGAASGSHIIYCNNTICLFYYSCGGLVGGLFGPLRRM